MGKRTKGVRIGRYRSTPHRRVVSIARLFLFGLPRSTTAIRFDASNVSNAFRPLMKRSFFSPRRRYPLDSRVERTIVVTWGWLYAYCDYWQLHAVSLILVFLFPFLFFFFFFLKRFTTRFLLGSYLRKRPSVWIAAEKSSIWNRYLSKKSFTVLSIRRYNWIQTNRLNNLHRYFISSPCFNWDNSAR